MRTTTDAPGPLLAVAAGLVVVPGSGARPRSRGGGVEVTGNIAVNRSST